MAKWVRLCSLSEAPAPGGVAEAEVEGRALCVANVAGELSVVDNQCPHRGGPLGQGWIEGDCIVCPWHSWMFHLKTGEAEYPQGERVRAFALQVDGDDVMVDVE